MECRSADLPPGFTLVSGKRRPPNPDQEYEVMFRRKNAEPYIDTKHTYRADQLNWIHDGGSFDVIAVRKV